MFDAQTLGLEKLAIEERDCTEQEFWKILTTPFPFKISNS